MKHILSAVMSGILLIFCLTACSTDSDNLNENNDKLQIVTTIFPEYDWVREILGEKANNAEVTFLLESGVDMHSFQPSVEDILKISECDMFVYVGGESDQWAQDALKEASNKDIVAVNLLEVLGDSVKEEEILEGMEHEDDEESEPDEHVWLSLKNAAVLTQYLADIVKDLDKDNSQLYQDNADAYINKLAGLDSDYENVCENSKLKTVIFGDRFPFRYLVDDYGIDYYAAFAGCSAETEASFKTVTFLSGKIDEIGTGSILVIDGSDKRIANTIKGNTSQKNQQILTMDSMQSAGTDDADYTYLNVMSNNLVVLKQALQ